MEEYDKAQKTTINSKKVIVVLNPKFYLLFYKYSVGSTGLSSTLISK